MLSSTRSRALLSLSRATRINGRRGYAFSANDKQEINDTTGTKSVPNVSKTNELPMDTPHQDAAISESTEHAEQLRVAQAPNRQSVWSRSQNPRSQAMSGPRFEQTIMEYQVCSPV